MGKQKIYRRCAVPSYERYRLQELVWKLRDVDDVPNGFMREPILDPAVLVSAYGFLFDEAPVEKFLVFVLNARNVCVAIDKATTGLLNSSLIHPREAFRSAIACCGMAVIFAHNHPSGNLEPSTEDLTITKQLVESGKILGIQVHDHIILGHNGCFTSFAERGLL